MEWQSSEDVISHIPFIEELRTARAAVGEPAWLVGGCVRDLLLGRKPVDFDLATPRPEPFARRFAGLIDGHVVPMDPERGIWRVAVSADLYYDFCAFRDDDILGDLRGQYL